MMPSFPAPVSNPQWAVACLNVMQIWCESLENEVILFFPPEWIRNKVNNVLCFHVILSEK